MKNPHVKLAYEHNPYEDNKMPEGYKRPVIKVRIVRDTRFPPVPHNLTLPERVRIIEERRRILREESKNAKSASD
jgi:hypothetical protein